MFLNYLIGIPLNVHNINIIMLLYLGFFDLYHTLCYVMNTSEKWCTYKKDFKGFYVFLDLLNNCEICLCHLRVFP
jgi:hypothetical protein